MGRERDEERHTEMRDRHGERRNKRYWERDMGRPRDMQRNMGNDKNMEMGKEA